MDDYGNIKLESLRKNGTLHPHPDIVVDDLFSGNEFFDPRDMVQVKYEMLRRVREDKIPVAQAVKLFGFSRVSFYQLQHAYDQLGLAGLMPNQRGPRVAHKLTDNVMTFISACKDADASIRASELAKRIKERFRLSVHPRSIERALERLQKKGR
jgi:transposase